MDWRKPHAATIDLALNRLPATDRAHRIGSLLIKSGAGRVRRRLRTKTPN
ncbi:hypothetical protein PV396_07925 [Streptomyces sp. ME02-8801-2C]|nr:hypothetical protein [Streptomyces sp. ME02-8801-2C]MDX3451873.1 hypothetical protein [Streptomyces sp. ME02-8801-2C]